MKKWQLPSFNLQYKGIQNKRKLSCLIWGKNQLHCFKNLENCLISPVYSYYHCCWFWCYVDYCCLLVIYRKTDKTQKTWTLLLGTSERDTVGDCTSLCSALIWANGKIYLKDIYCNSIILGRDKESLFIMIKESIH